MKRHGNNILIAVAMLGVLCVVTSAVAADKPATVKLGVEDVALEITFDSGRKIVVNSKGTPLDAGTYVVKSLRMFRQDARKRVWELRSEGSLSTLESITVAAGQEKVLDTGGKIHVNYFTWAHPKGDDLYVLVRLNFRGGYSENYYAGAYLGGKKPAMPVYRISTTGGKVLAEGRFENNNGTAIFDWPVPKGLEEQCKIEVKATMGPFEWEAQSTEFSPKPRN